MPKLAALILLIAAAGCHDSKASAPHTPTTTAAAPAAAAADPHAQTVEALAGVWVGQALGTPLGDMQFALAFDREPGGDLHARTDDGKGMYLDFRFHHDAAAGWTLVETGAIPDVGEQTHTLLPAAAGPDGPRWLDRDDPSYLDVALAVTADQLVLTTKVHGESHAVLKLQRIVGPAAEQVRQAIAGQPAGTAR